MTTPSATAQDTVRAPRAEYLGAETFPARLVRLTVKIAAYGWLVVFAIATIMPLIWMVSTAFKPNELVLKIPPQIVPTSPTTGKLSGVLQSTRCVAMDPQLDRCG